MKKLLLSLGLIVGLSALAHAGTPQLNNPYTGGNYANTSFFGYFSPTASTGVVIGATLTSKATSTGVSAIPGRYCLTHFTVNASTAVTVYFVDGSTIPAVTYTGNTISANAILVSGNGIGGGTTPQPQYNQQYPQLEPFCIAAGDQLGLAVTGTGSFVSNVSWDGFITYAPAGGSTNNQGL